MRRPRKAFGALLCMLHCGCASLGGDQLASCHRYNAALQGRFEDLGSRNNLLQERNGELAQSNLELEIHLEESDRLIASLQSEFAARPIPDKTPLASPAAPRLSGDVQVRLSKLSRDFPNVADIDPVLGICRFRSDILFGPDNTDLTPEARDVLFDLARLLSDPEGAELQLLIAGHTDLEGLSSDSRAGGDANWHVSADRAIAVARFLESVGVNPRRLAATGFGTNQPISRDSAVNRRVELFLIPRETPMVGTTNIEVRSR